MKTESDQFLPEPPAIAPGAQDFFLPGGPIGVLIIHGYGGTIGDYRRFGETLHQHEYSVMGVRLAGHGQTLEVLRATSSLDWQTSVNEAAKKLRAVCQEIVVIGSSFGGALALNYARNFPDHLQAVIVVNPAIRYRAGGKLQTLALRMLRLVTPDYRKPGISSADAERYRQLGSMTHWPIDGIFETYRFIRQEVVPHLAAITTPTLVMAIADDPIVHADSARLIHDRVGAAKKKIVWLPGKTHRPFRDEHLVQVMVDEIRVFLGS